MDAHAYGHLTKGFKSVHQQKRQRKATEHRTTPTTINPHLRLIPRISLTSASVCLGFLVCAVTVLLVQQELNLSDCANLSDQTAKLLSNHRAQERHAQETRASWEAVASDSNTPAGGVGHCV
eukprot:scaffold12325_cov33-Prasinocladus_malaysianus.AAC.1